MFNIYYYILPIDLYFINIYSSAFLYFEKYRFEFINDFCSLTIGCHQIYEEITPNKSFTVFRDKQHVSKNKIIEYITKDILFEGTADCYEFYINSYTVKSEEDFEKRLLENVKNEKGR